MTVCILTNRPDRGGFSFVAIQFPSLAEYNELYALV